MHDNSFGDLGGDIRYFQVKYKNGNKSRTKNIAYVTYFPGDNEYGAIYYIYKSRSGSKYASLIGTVGDSDLYYLKYFDLDESK